MGIHSTYTKISCYDLAMGIHKIPHTVVEQKAPLRPRSPTWDVSFGRKCRARDLIGCEGDHVMLQCSKLLGMKLSERKEVLEKSGLCLFYLKHAAELECYGRGGLSRPRCTQAGCDGEHTPGVHELLGEEHVGVNMVAGDECESDEDENWWVGVVRVEEAQEEEVETLEETDEAETKGEARYITSILTRKDDSGLEDEFECLWEAHAPSSPDGLGKGKWWSPEPPHPSSEEDGEEIRYLMQVLGLGSPEDEERQDQGLGSTEERTYIGEGTPTPEASRNGKAPHPKSAKRRKLRKKVTESKDQGWEQVRQDTWLREMLTDTSESESEEKYGRFVESGRWIMELTGVPQQATTTPRGECSRQKMPDS
jgi:hypothetical protein